MNLKLLVSGTLASLLLGSAASAQYSVSGNVYNDPTGGNIDGSAVPFSLPPEKIQIALIETVGNTIAKTVAVNSVDGSFIIADVAPGTYYAMVITPNVTFFIGDPAPPPILETGWVRTGESLFSHGELEEEIDGRTDIFVIVDNNVSNVKFGVQERPFADNKIGNLLDKTATSVSSLTVNTAADFTQGGDDILSGSDNGGGSITNYTINVLPKYGTLYLGTTAVASLADVDSLTPTQFATLGYLPGTAALAHEQDYFTYYVADDIGAKSNNATFVIPFSVLDSDGDTYANRDDQDDDNDGITDLEECPLNGLGGLTAAYLGNEFTFLRPSVLGYSIAHRTGIDTTIDISDSFGYPANSAAIIVSISNANTHPFANEFYVNDSTGATQWAISGSVQSYTVLDHGQQYFSYDTRTLSVLNATPKSMALVHDPSDPAADAWWSKGTDDYSWWVKSDTTLRMHPTVTDSIMPRLGLLSVALTDPEPKYFQFASTANNLNEWATYFVSILPECDYDMDGIPDRLDLDSDNDGCFDAIEGATSFNYDDLNTDGSLAGTTATSGIPTSAGSGQALGTSQDSTAYDPVCFLAVTGTVFDDANNNTLIDALETGTTAGTDLYIYLINSMGEIVDSAEVLADGTYTLQALPNQNYTIALSTTQYAIGSNTPVATTLPDGWMTTGENGAGSTGTGDGTPNGILAITVATSDITDKNFGIQQLPETVIIETDEQIMPPAGTPINVEGVWFVTGPITSTTDYGTGVVDSIRFTAFPTGADSITIGDTTYTSSTWPAGGVTAAYDATTGVAGVEVYPTSGVTEVFIPIAAIDNAGAEDQSPGSITIPVKTLTISGNVWNDADAGNVNLTETTNVIPTGLFANLLDALGNVVASVPVNTDGTYEFTTVQPATYTVQLSSSAGTAGSPATAYTTPDGWVNTGAFNGPENTGNTGTTTGTSAGIMVTSDNVSNINFGIQQLPESDTISTTITSPAVNDTLQIGIGALPGLSGSDPEDGAYSAFAGTNGQPQGIIITSLPTNGTLLYNGVAVEVGDTLTDIGAGVLEIVFTGTGYDETEFEYAYIDRAGFADPTPAVYSINWSTPLPVSLLNFEVSKSNDIAILKWATASEQNNAGFHIEHSTDAANWKNIGFAKTKAENGNSSARLDYSYHHNSPAVGINYYRLKQMDIDGKFSISNVRQISFDQVKAISIHPNPATNVLTVDGINAHDAITVTDVLGKEIVTAKGSNATLQIDIAHLNAGTYYLNIVSADGSKAVSKFVKK